MKNILLLLTLLIGLQTANAQYVTIPDANFRAALKALYPSCFNGNDMMDTTCNNINYSTSITVRNKNIQSLDGIQYFKRLTELDCRDNKITRLRNLPNSINYYIFCSNNLITQVDSIPPLVKQLLCDNNKLTSLPTLPLSLTKLNCSYNQLTSLPELPISLNELNCSNNRLTTLPPLPNAIGAIFPLEYLYCNNNQLTLLPELPTSLNTLNCSYNRLTTLPTLPNTLTALYCSFNNLTSQSIGSFPISLFHLYINNNNFVSLPKLPISLSNLNCSYNKLTTLPPLPNLNTLYCNNNPLSCLPLLPFDLQELRIKRTQVFCLPNTLNTSIRFDTILPICSNISGICPVNPFVQGRVYNDLNNNGSYNTGEQLFSQQIVKVSPSNWLGASDVTGTYLVKLDTAINNTWSAINNYRYATITPASYSLANIHNLGLQSGSYDFGAHLIPNVKDLETTLGSSPARPGFTTNVSITVNNVGTVNQSNITIKLKKPNGFSVLSSSIVPTSTINDTLIWKNISINYLAHQSINIQLQVPVNAVLGSTIDYEAWSNGTQGDTTSLDNYAKWTETIRGSFDPNDKLVNRASLPPTYNANKDRLLYTIRFQNTGTDTAFTVIVRDVILNNIDVTSLRVINASHAYQLIVREKNIVEIAFPNIQLPATIQNEAKSHGFVQLEFKPKIGLVSNDSIANKASIFFDYNAPVITNTATTKIQITTSIASNKKLAFKLFPNPASEMISVELPYEGKGKWFLIDISGKLIKQNNIENNARSFDINVNDVANGTYLLSLEVNDIVSTSKVVIVR